MTTITPGVHRLQIWTLNNDPIRPDLFRLEDGREIEITRGQEIDAERTRHAVLIKSSGYGFRADYGDGHRHVEGHAGWIIKNRKHCNWELYPLERVVSHNARGASERYGIKSEVNATPRTAALELIELSDELQRKNYGFYFSKTATRKAGPWDINALAKHADGTDFSQDPSSVRLDHDRIRHYCARHENKGTIRVAAERAQIGTGYGVRIFVVPSPGLAGCTGRIQTVPARIERWIETRIHSV